MTDPGLQKALDYLEAHHDEYTHQLVEFSRIPSVSAEGFDPQDVRRSAEFVEEALRRIGLENVERWTPEGGHPYVKGEWLKKPGAPTILLYAHHDVQPPGRPAFWTSPAFEPDIRDGRLYGRGTVDDKAGVMMHVAAMDAWMKTAGGLPLNVKFIVDGEEEIGSPNFERVLREHKEELAADVVVLNDTLNHDTGIPSLTYRLRGLVVVDVELVSIRERLHSGFWGGVVPDPVMGLCRLLATLTNEDGSIAVPELLEGVRPPSDWERAQLDALPYSEAMFRKQAGMLPGVKFAGRKDASVWEKLWFHPSVGVTAMEAGPLHGATNQIIDSARARVGVRIVPDQNPEQIRDALIDHLQRNTPLGLQIRTKCGATAPSWRDEPSGPFVDATLEALREGYGRDAVFIGCGGTIPFVEPVVKTWPGTPALLVGVEDPLCRAHAENESLDLGDWKKCVRSSAILYDKLSRVSAK